MRIFGLIAIVALSACAVDTGGARQDEALAAARGTALPPPSGAAIAGRSAPPEGQGAGGLDFGHWRSADPAPYATTFQEQIRARYSGRQTGDIRTELEANGFACEDGRGLDCRIEIMERQCAHDWYVVVEPGRAPIAGFDKVCLGAR
jgi:hypothetical protein